jgi:hypothetical protein
LGHGIRIHAGGRVEDDTVTNPLLARHRLKHPIDHTDMEVHVIVQAGAKAVYEGDRTDVQGGGVYIGGAWRMSLQALRNDPQEDAQHHIQHYPIALHEVAQPLGNRQHPLAHRQAGKHMVAKMCRRLHHAPRVAG